MKKEFYITHVFENQYLINRTLVTVYRDMDNNVTTNPRLESDDLNMLRHFITEYCIKKRNEKIQK